MLLIIELTNQFIVRQPTKYRSDEDQSDTKTRMA